MSSADLRVLSAFNSIDPNGMKWRGSWGIIGIYEQNDVVLGSNNESYICVSPSGSVAEDPTTNPAIWELLSSGTATAVSVSTSNGSGITVAEPTPNNFTVATNLVAGSGISFTPSGVNTSLTVANSGVLSVSAGTGISVGGTAQNPSVINTGVLSVSAGTGISIGGTAQAPIISQAFPSQTLIVDNRLSGGALNVNTPPGGAVAQITVIPVVAGGRYTLTAACAVTSTASSAGQMSIVCAPTLGPGLGPNGVVYSLLGEAESTVSSQAGAAVSFTVPAGFTNYGIYVSGFGVGGGSVISGQINSLYLTRWA